ncbi:MAG: T9SS type A sorting domain-containing protein [Bacteroidales bacterium]|nr:T9SS type A sorting domain-containing protein [Bacteroidales bacterium]
MMRISFILFLALSSSLMTLAQEADDFLSDFLVTQQGEYVYLRWTIKSGNTCDGTLIKRSTDNVYYDVIGEISGICGSPDQPVTYDFTDSLPQKNRTNYYRLELGQYGNTSAKAIDVITLNDDGYSIQPNPVASRSKIVFKNPDGEELEFCLIDARGRMVMNRFTTSGQVWIDRNDIPGGMYVFKLRKGETVMTKGKVLVL